MNTNGKTFGKTGINSILFIFLLMACTHSYAQLEIPDDKTLSPYFFVKSDDASVDQMPLLSTRAEVNIAGIIAAVKLTQVYKNSGSKPIEAIYVFPASTRAAVNRMKMTIGERTVEAIIRERQQARQDYEKAKQQGQSASLLEQQRPNVFQMNVANIMPGDKITVVLEYSELLIPEKGLYTFAYPTVVGPRYSNQALASAKAEEKWVANPYTHQGQAPAYTFDLSCNLNAGMPIAEIRSTSHAVDINFTGQEIARVKLKNFDQGNKDFILQYRLSGKQLESGLLLYEGKDENFFLAMVQPPATVKASSIPRREYIFVVDVSGSMNGYPLNISKKLFRDLLGNIKSSDFFNILLFAGGSQLFSENSVPATSENIESGISFIDNQQGGGGTELLPALKRALSLGSGEGMARSFIIATDGYVAVEKESFGLIRDNLNKANFFAFGIGTAVNRYLIEGIAHAGMGNPFIITNELEAGAMATRFREYVETPVLTDIRVSYEGIDVYDVEPSGIPDVFSERPVMIFGKYRAAMPGAAISLYGKSGEGDFREKLEFIGAASVRDNNAIRYLWARERIRNLDDFGGPLNEKDAVSIQKQVTELGLNYELLTQYTSFVAIDSEVRNKSGQNSTVTQPLPLPEGVSDYAVGGVASGAVQMCKSMTITNCAESNSYRAVKKGISVNPGEIEAKADSSLAVFEESADFQGGKEALDKYMGEHLVYPAMAKANHVSGIVYVAFTVGKDGSISDARILKGIGGGCDEEALRLVKTMPRWKPAKQSGKAVKSKYVLPVRFKL